MHSSKYSLIGDSLGVETPCDLSIGESIGAQFKWYSRIIMTQIEYYRVRVHQPGMTTSSTQPHHYNDVIMTTMASQITSLTVVYSTVYSDADQRKHQSSASLAFVWGIHRDRWIPRTKGQLRGKCCHLMTSSWLNPWCRYVTLFYEVIRIAISKFHEISKIGVKNFHIGFKFNRCFGQNIDRPVQKF